MGHFAKIVDGKVIQVITAEPEFFETFIDSSPGLWLQTSYNTLGNVHYGQDGKPDGKPALRANYAGVGYTYDHKADVFYAPQPYPSWILNTSTYLWEAPIPYPDDTKGYLWNEETQNWVELV